MSLVDNCINVLGEEAVVLSKKETDAIFDTLIQRFPFTHWGRIDWHQGMCSITVKSILDILSFLRDQRKETTNNVFILWDEAKLPSIKSNIHVVLGHIGEITIVSFDTWIFCPDDNYVVEFYHEGDITIGFSK